MGTSCLQKMFGPPSIGKRLQLRRQDHERLRRSCCERREGQDETIVDHVPREMSRTFWHFIMHGRSVGCEITGRRTLVGCEITGRRMLRKGGADKRGGAHSRYQFFRCVINRGGADK